MLLSSKTRKLSVQGKCLAPGSASMLIILRRFTVEKGNCSKTVILVRTFTTYFFNSNFMGRYSFFHQYSSGHEEG